MENNYYFTDLEVFAKWKHSKIRTQLSYSRWFNAHTEEELLELMRLQNEKLRNRQSNSGTHGGKIAGPISGKISVDSGRWLALKTSEHQTNAGKKGGKRNIELHKEELLQAAAKWKLDNPEKQKQMGIKMNENTDPEFRKQHNTKVANKIYIMSDGFVIKTAFAKSKYEKENPGVSVIASYVQGDNEYDYYHNTIVERKEQERLDKLKSKPCKHCGTECKPRGLYTHEKNCKFKTK